MMIRPHVWRANDPCHDRDHYPHAAFYSEEGLVDSWIKASETTQAPLNELRNVVN
jgi:hypothetical protein